MAEHGRLQAGEGPPSGPQLARRTLACGAAQAQAALAALQAGRGDAECVHDLRVALRRLRCALRDLRCICPGLPRHLDPALRAAFRQLGVLRDAQVAQALLQEASAAGRVVAQASPQAALRSACGWRLKLALRALVVYAEERFPGKSRRPRKLRRRAGEQLQHLHGQVLASGRHFDRLSRVERHTLRKRLKRLRYLSDSLTDLFGARRSAHHVACLAQVQDRLGALQDTERAIELARRQVRSGRTAPAGSEAALPALRQRAEVLRRACRRALKRLLAMRPFWRRGRE